MPVRPMTTSEHALQRDLVATSLLFVAEDRRSQREPAIDPGTNTPSAAKPLSLGALLEEASGLHHHLTPIARSTR
jgi:hypothetical protein